jgi:hypothetical protein
MAIEDNIFEDIKKYQNEILPHAANIAKIEVKEFNKYIADISLVTVNQDPTVNGYVSYYNNTFHIKLNWSLLVYFAHMSMLFVTKLIIIDRPLIVPSKYNTINYQIKDRHIIEKTSFSNEEINKMTLSLLQDFWGKNAYNSNMFNYFKKLQPLQMGLASTLLGQMLHFVIAHEFGHILIELYRKKLENLSAREILLDLGNTLAKIWTKKYFDLPSDEFEKLLNGKTKENLLENWSDEISADLNAWNLCMNLYNEQPINQLSFIEGVELMFIMLKLLENYYIKINNKLPQFTSHPLSSYRLYLFQTTSGKNKCKDEIGLFEHTRLWEEFSDEILNNI